MTFFLLLSCSSEKCGDDNSSCVSTAEAKSCKDLTGKDYYSSLNLLVDNLIVCVDHRPECIVGSCGYEPQKIIEDPSDSSKNIIMERRASESEMYWVGEVEIAEVELDSDSDAFPDSIDLCPNTPEGVEIFKMGCSLEQWTLLMDLDGDGVLNNNDNCPNTKAGEAVDELGCSEEDLAGDVDMSDIDGDGVKNENDKCPGTEKNAAQIDLTNGCSKEQFDESDFDSDGVKNKDEGETSDGNSCVELSGKPFSQGCPLELKHKQEICEKYSSGHTYLKGKLEVPNGESIICKVNPRFTDLVASGFDKDYETLSKDITYDVSKRLMKDGTLYLIEGEMIRLANEKFQTDLIEIEVELELPDSNNTPSFSYRFVGESGMMTKFETKTSSNTWKIKIDKSNILRSVFEFKFDNLGDFNCGVLEEGKIYARQATSIIDETRLKYSCVEKRNGILGFYISDFNNGDISEVKITLKDPTDLMSIGPIILNKKNIEESIIGLAGQNILIDKVEYTSNSNRKYFIKARYDKTSKTDFLENIKNAKFDLVVPGEVSQNRYGFLFTIGKVPVENPPTKGGDKDDNKK